MTSAKLPEVAPLRFEEHSCGFEALIANACQNCIFVEGIDIEKFLGYGKYGQRTQTSASTAEDSKTGCMNSDLQVGKAVR
jgi:hypothetical protein